MIAATQTDQLRIASLNTPSWFKSRLAILGRWDLIGVIAVVTVLWVPRITGPIDLRWDAGVYYVLGTSLAQGDGYRILSEPGSPQALQYPPLLPVIVAAHQLVLGTSDWHVVAPWVRKRTQ